MPTSPSPTKATATVPTCMGRSKAGLGKPPTANFSEAMPLYDYRCKHCGRVVADVLAAYDDPPPTTEEPCGSVPAHSSTQFPCDLERLTCAGSWRWKGDYNNEGRGGWTRQGDFMSRKVDSRPKRIYPTTRRGSSSGR